MSTIKTDALSNLAGSKTVPMDTVVDGSAKAWVNFNGIGTVAIRASFNVASITDNGVGDYTVNFTNSLVDANYAVKASSSAYYGSERRSSVSLFSDGAAGLVAPTTSAARIITTGGANATADPTYVCVAVFR